MTEKPQPATERRRRIFRPQFTLTMLFIVMVLVSVLFATARFVLDGAKGDEEFDTRFAILVIIAPPLMMVTLMIILFVVMRFRKRRRTRDK